jgi:hypothetical protein
MRNHREKAVRNRSKNMRTLTIREIKMAICVHEMLAPEGPPEQQAVGDVWLTKLTCPACGAWYIRETPDTARPAPRAGARAGVISGSRHRVATPMLHTAGGGPVPLLSAQREDT